MTLQTKEQKVAFLRRTARALRKAIPEFAAITVAERQRLRKENEVKMLAEWSAQQRRELAALSLPQLRLLSRLVKHEIDARPKKPGRPSELKEIWTQGLPQFFADLRKLKLEPHEAIELLAYSAGVSTKTIRRRLKAQGQNSG